MNIVFTGDICLNNINQKSFSYDDKYKKIVKESDILVGNLECPITDSNIKKGLQVKNLSATYDTLELLNDFDVVSLANNHIQDFCNQGINDTITALNSKCIAYFGVGKDINEAVTPYTYENDKKKIAIFGATRYANQNGENYGTIKDSSIKLYKSIKEYSKRGYFVIVYFHWGYEYVRIPSPRERRLAHKAIDYGANIIIGAHPHIYQGIEKYKGRTIIYSLGNFIFASKNFIGHSPILNDDRLRNSFLVKIVLKSDYSYHVECLGYEISDEGVRMYDEQENESLLEQIKFISKDLKSINSLAYLQSYYKQAYNISQQNIKVREKFQNASQLALHKKISLYFSANYQDILNRLFAILIKLFR